MSKWKNHKKLTTFITCRPFWFTEVKRVSTTNTLLSSLFFIYFFKCAIKKTQHRSSEVTIDGWKYFANQIYIKLFVLLNTSYKVWPSRGEKLGWDPAFADKMVGTNFCFSLLGLLTRPGSRNDVLTTPEERERRTIPSAACLLEIPPPHPHWTAPKHDHQLSSSAVSLDA